MQTFFLLDSGDSIIVTKLKVSAWNIKEVCNFPINFRLVAWLYGSTASPLSL